uniref:SGNH hydrolase-type esterase domain-containing protein n=1 Tax=Eutreptiella gymnastica TaxID=73025 RepID=A0A7S1HZZ6_9EUGL|mmetsp:Transcript_117732/g.204994  ORF Transcript_117732/g.204994 Transcript_117732/m.204994 type:complete len:325 (+) Transcript_117732:40-1014(+)
MRSAELKVLSLSFALGLLCFTWLFVPRNDPSASDPGDVLVSVRQPRPTPRPPLPQALSPREESGPPEASPAPPKLPSLTGTPASSHDFRCPRGAKEIRILAFGDSITQGGYGLFEHPAWGMRHNSYFKPRLQFHAYTVELQKLLSAHRFRRVKVVNKGIAGETAAHMTQRLPNVLLKDPDFNMAFVLAGTNDLHRGTKPATCLGYIEHMHKTLHQYNITAYQISLPDCCPYTTGPKGTPYQGFATRCREYNPMLEAMAKPAGRYIDVAAHIPQREDTKALWDDCMHFSPQGYDEFGNLVFQFLRRRLEAACSGGCMPACAEPVS